MTAAPAAAIPSFLAGYPPQPADFDGWVQTPFSFLTGKVLFRGEQTSSQSLTGATYTILQVNAVLEDPYGGWSDAATGSQPAYSWLAPYDGWYEVIVTVAITAAATHLEPCALLSGQVQYEASAASTPAGTAGVVCAPIRLPMIGGLDYVQAQAWISATETVSLVPGLQPTVEIAWISN